LVVEISNRGKKLSLNHENAQENGVSIKKKKKRKCKKHFFFKIIVIWEQNSIQDEYYVIKNFLFK